MSSVSISGDVSGAISIAAPSAAGSGTLTLPVIAADTLAGIAATQTLTNKTLTSPALSGTVTGTYTLGGTPTLTDPALGTPTSGVLTNCTGTANSLNAGLGVNQTWTVVTGSRALGTTYTNSTGKPISVVIGVNTSVNNAAFVLTIGGVVAVSTVQYTSQGYVTGIVPNGLTYVVTVGGGIALQNWQELR